MCTATVWTILQLTIMIRAPLLPLALAVAAHAADTGSPCTECASAEAQALWWPKTGLNCPPGPLCDICATTAQEHVCSLAKTAAACCDLCAKWNADDLPNGVTSNKKCDAWYFTGEACLLKEGGGFTKERYDPVTGDAMTSGPGCHVRPRFPCLSRQRSVSNTLPTLFAAAVQKLAAFERWVGLGLDHRSAGQWRPVCRWRHRLRCQGARHCAGCGRHRTPTPREVAPGSRAGEGRRRVLPRLCTGQAAGRAATAAAK